MHKIWTKEDEDKIVDWVQKNGSNNWNALSK